MKSKGNVFEMVMIIANDVSLIPQFPSACSQSAFQSVFLSGSVLLSYWTTAAKRRGITIRQFITNLFIAFTSRCVRCIDPEKDLVAFTIKISDDKFWFSL